MPLHTAALRVSCLLLACSGAWGNRDTDDCMFQPCDGRAEPLRFGEGVAANAAEAARAGPRAQRRASLLATAAHSAATERSNTTEVRADDASEFRANASEVRATHASVMRANTREAFAVGSALHGFVETLAVVSALGAPVLVGLAVALFAGCCACYCCCRRLQIRDCYCCKRFLRCVWDRFDEFEVTILVHELLLEKTAKKEAGKMTPNNPLRDSKITTSVRVRAGRNSETTDPNSQGIYQTPLTILVEQGATKVYVDLLDSKSKVMATLTFDSEKQILNWNNKGELPSEQVFTMKPKDKKDTSNPKLKITIGMGIGINEEPPLLSGMHMSGETGWLIRQELAKAGTARETMSQLELLATTCKGPLDRFEGMGNAKPSYVGVTQREGQKKWIFGVWASEDDFGKKVRPKYEIELMKIRSVQPDPARSNVFSVNYFDEAQMVKQLNFRRIDRARDVWIETLQLLVKEVYAERDAKKEAKKERKAAAK